ncbi:DUF2514 family protein [Pseudomonas fulva]|uniref:DUF2514 family protein n=1 Tax=Pseudomonas fulva TaxID=47880 RepID=UPI000B2AD933
MWYCGTADRLLSAQDQTGTYTVVVLGGLLEDADREEGSLALALERSRVAGLACNSVYNALIK